MSFGGKIENFLKGHVYPTIVPPLAANLLKVIYNSCNHYTLNDEKEKELLKSGRPVLYATWHFDFPGIAYLFGSYLERDRSLKGTVMVSASKDGELVARVLTLFGFKVIRGSSHRKGVEALTKMIKMVKKGYHTGLMADGSKGPARKAQKGIILVAKYTGSPIMPVITSGKPRLVFPSWDRTHLCLPFGTIVTAFGNPIHVSSKASREDMETARIELETQLNILTEKVEGLLSRI